ncbi:MAG: sugar phosphate isomerase/epimerase [Opitutaceae bacterium]|nr:sugar phosphate isomerase/epimerase [Opitutaceae bacterium]
MITAASPLDRRAFLKLSAAAGLATATAPLLRAASAGAPDNPFKRSGKPKLKLSLAAYSFRESFPIMRGKATKVAPGKATDMFKFIDYCAAQGCAGAELTTYFFPDETDATMIRLRRHAYLRGVEVSGTAIGNNFSLPKGSPKLAEEIATTKKWIDRALLMGAQHIRVFAGNIPKDAPKDFTRAAADKVVIDALAECCDYAGKKGIFLGLENHDSIGSAATLIPMVKAVNSPWCGINLDSGNFRTPDPYKDFAECVPYALNVQFKVELHGAKPSEKKSADLKRFTQILRDGGYQGWVALEYEAKEDPAVAVPRYLAEMKALFA